MDIEIQSSDLVRMNIEIAKCFLQEAKWLRYDEAEQASKLYLAYGAIQTALLYLGVNLEDTTKQP